MCVGVEEFLQSEMPKFGVMCNFVLVSTNSFQNKRYETCRTMRS